MIPIFWFDKDGVLAKYDYAMYESEAGAPAPWTIRNAHIYRHLDTYENMAAAFRSLYSNYGNKAEKDCVLRPRVLTSVSDGLTLSEHVLDGMSWCQERLHLRPSDFYACAVPKESIPVSLKREITRMDVLLDDYMPNLINWQKAGGTSVKVLNGINSPTDKFHCISVAWTPDFLITRMKEIADKVRNDERLCGGLNILHGTL